MERVLVVEDENPIRLLLSTILRQKGFAVVTSVTAEEALEHLQQEEEFQLVITDIQLPGINGLDLMEWVKRHFPALPVIVISAYAHRLAEAGQRGADNQLKKPFSYRELVDMVDATLTGMPD
jgi:DNA-binding NtrC family response regulator